jgi:hypothetical protein
MQFGRHVSLEDFVTPVGRYRLWPKLERSSGARLRGSAGRSPFGSLHWPCPTRCSTSAPASGRGGCSSTYRPWSSGTAGRRWSRTPALPRSVERQLAGSGRGTPSFQNTCIRKLYSTKARLGSKASVARTRARTLRLWTTSFSSRRLNSCFSASFGHHFSASTTTSAHG